MSDILLSVGLQTGTAETSKLQTDLQTIISNLDRNPPKVRVGLTVDPSALNHFKTQLTQIVNSVGLSKGAPITVNISGLGEISTKAGNAREALSGVAAAAREAASAVNGMNSIEAANSLTNINNLIIKLQANYAKWTAAQTGSSSTAYASYGQQIDALHMLKEQVKSNAISAEEFAEAFALIRARATEAAAAIQSVGEDKAASKIKILTADSEEYNAALSKAEKLLAQVKHAQDAWTAAKTGKSSSAYASLSGYQLELENLINKLLTGAMSADEFAVAFGNIKHRVGAAEGSIRSAGEATKTFGDRLKGLAAKFGTWFSITRVIMLAVRAIRQMVTSVREVDTAMTELKKVTNETDAVYKKFLNDACVRAKRLGAALSETVNATSDFARLGYGIKDASVLADTALIYKNIGDGIEDINEASESIISTMQAFGIEASDAMAIVDKFNEVGNNFAISSAGIGEAMTRSSAAMAAANNTIDETIALITAANTIVQNPEKVGTTMKTLSMYLRAAKTEAEEAGESTDGMANSVSELRDELIRLTGNKVDIMLDDNTFKSTYQILKELSAVWDSLTDVSRANILEMIGGKRNANVVAAILEDFSVAERALETSMTSAGSAMKENEKHLESINGKVAIFKASFEEFSQNFIGSDLVKDIVDLGTALIGVLNTVAKIVNAVGGLNTILYTTMAIIVTIKANVILTSVIAFFTKLATGILAFGTTLKSVAAAFKVFIAMTKASHTASAGAMMVYGQSTSVLGRLAAAFRAVGISASTAQIAVAAFMIVLTSIILVIQSYNKAQKEAEQKAEETRQRNIQAAQTAASLSDEISTLINRYIELNDVTGVNSDNVQQLISTKTELITALKLEQDELDALIKKYGSYSDAVKQASIDTLKKAERELRGGLNARREELLKAAAPETKYEPGVGEVALNNLVAIYGEYLSQTPSDGSAALKVINALNNSPLFKASNAGSLFMFSIEGMTADDLNSVEGILAAYDKLGEALDLIDATAGSSNEVYDILYEQYSKVTAAINNYNGAIGDLNTNLAEQFMLDGLIGKEVPKTEAEFAAFRDSVIAAALASGEFIGTTTDISAAVDNVLMQQPQFMKFYNDYTSKATEAADVTHKFATALSKINALNSGLGELSKIYSDILDGGDFDWGALLDNEAFTSAFSGLGDEYDDFIETIANSPDNIEACQDAFDNLVFAYLSTSDALKGVTDETRNATIAILKQAGVANAAELVDAQLLYNKEMVRLQTELGTDATYEEIMAMYAECEAGSLTSQILARLAATKLLTNETGIQTVGDIEQLEGLAKSANATEASLLRIAQAKALMAKAEKLDSMAANWKPGAGFDNYLSYVEQADAARKEAQELLSKPLEYNEIDFSKYEVQYSGGSATSSAKDKSGNSKEETWFVKQLSMHQHLVAMNQETQEEYLTWLNSAYKKAYDEGIIDLNDYYKYTEEVYRGLQDLFRDYLSDVEHEISMRENYDGEARKIIELYEGLIKKVEKEIADARARGLTDEDDYIQELQKKWQDYTGSIEDLRDEITESAKDALDELIDYRVDMLKQEIEDEKDALDERLDNLKEFYDKQKEMLQDQRDEENYLKDQSDKRKTVTDLQAELAMLANDDSAWAQKRKLELQEEITTAQEDLDEFEKDHALDLALDALDKAYNDQEAQLQAEMDALEERLNDPEALYNKALEDIRKNSENQLYYQMLMYNRQYGDGNDETVKDLWESAFGALSDYEKLFGELYKGVGLENETGVEDEGGWNDETISGTNPDNQQPITNPSGSTTTETPKSYPYGKASESSGNISKGSTGTKVKAIQYALNERGFGNSGTADCDGVFGNGTQSAVMAFQSAMGISVDGIVGKDTRDKFKAQGYAVGTSSATPGIHAVDELGTEYIFESPSDGTRYRMFHGGEKVLTADATDFLYQFANSGGSILAKMISDLFRLSSFGNISKPVQAIEVNSGDIIVQGNASERTVSEIRRAQRENLEFVLKSLNSLNK